MSERKQELGTAPTAVKSDHLNKQKTQEELLFLMAKMKTAFRRAGVAVEGHQKLQQRPKQD